MLLELHVRNLALIEKADLDFEKGLTVLSGETGAGKSILLEAVGLALGSKAPRDIVRTGAEYANIELVFGLEGADIRRAAELGFDTGEDGILIISRKISPSRSISRVNDETVTAGRLRELTSVLIDIHGQHEHQSLMYASRQLEIIDGLAGTETAGIKLKLREGLRRLNEINDILENDRDSALRLREAELLRYEIEEISSAKLKPGEEEELEEEYRKLKNISRISSAVARSMEILENEDTGKALKSLTEASEWDSSLSGYREQLADIEAMSFEVLRGLESYARELEYDEESFSRLQERLDFIRRLKAKYSESIEGIYAELERKKDRLAFIENFDEEQERLTEEKDRLDKELLKYSMILREMRLRTVQSLKRDISAQLEELNFPGVRFDIELENLEKPSAEGMDRAMFMISTNPGEPLKPVRDVASGGELSRIMLAVKTVLADTDEVGTMIFDEVDAGISGRTAQKVAERLLLIGRNRQVICISHLPQIAAMADSHYLIEKNTDGIRTRTEIRRLEGEEINSELARLIGGSEITRAVIDTAGEMKRLANELKLKVQEVVR